MPDEEYAQAPMSPRKSKKTAVLTTLLILVLLAAAGGGYYLWSTNQSLTEQNTQNEADLSSLRRQLAEAKTTPSPTPTPVATATPTPLPPIALKEFTVKLTPTAAIADLTATYAIASKSFSFNTKSLAAKGGACATGAPLGTLTRQAKGTAAPTGPTKAATVGTFDYYYTAPTTGCSSDAAVVTTQTDQANALKASLAGLN